MAALTINSADARKAIRFLEDVTITNQTAASTAVTKAVKVPEWAHSCTFYIFFDSSGGTTPKFDFVVGMPDFGQSSRLSAPTDDTDSLLGNQLWDGITQVTGNGPYVIVVHIDPDLDAADDTGSANASCTYIVKAVLPPWLYYTYTTQDAADDADYRFRIVAHFKGDGRGR